MVALKVEMFGGMVPAADPRISSVPNSQAEYAVNAWLDTGVLTGFYTPKHVATASFSPVGKVYRIPNNYDTPYLMLQNEQSYYMFFANPDTDVVRGATIDDIYDRYYWASSSEPPKYNTKARIVAGDGPFLLGIPAPLTAPLLSVIGGASSVVRATAYVVTFVTEYGEESAPSPPVNGTGKIDASWDLSAIPVPGASDLGGPGADRWISKKRIYRTVVGSTGVATFFFVAEIPPAQTTYSDTFQDDVISSNAQLDSQTWTAPPSDLQGFCMGPNGILCSWRENEVWFSEPYRPHAWPSLYVLTVEYPIVGLASIGNSIYVLTRGYPVVVVGTSPLNLQPMKVSVFEPCTSRGGIVTFPEGVYYPSGNGLILLQSGVAANVTQGFITKKTWQQNVRNATFRAAKLGQLYYGYGSATFGVFQPDTFQMDAFQDLDITQQANGIAVAQPINQRLALMLLHSDVLVNNVQNDVWSSELFILKEDKVYWLDLSDEQQLIEPAIWHSRDIQLQWPASFSATKIYFRVPSSTPAQNPVRDIAQNMTLTEDKYGIIRWYGDDRLLAAHEIRKSGEMLRLPSDSKFDFIRFEVETRVEISSIHFGQSPKDLRSV